MFGVSWGLCLHHNFAFAAVACLMSVSQAQVWTETQIFEPTDAATLSSYGFYGAMDDGWIASASNGTDSRVLFIERIGPGEWIQRQLIEPSPLSGGAIAMSGPVVVLGQEGFQGNRGVAMVFERAGDGNWSQSATLSPEDLLPFASFGRFVAASGDRIAVQAGFIFAPEARDAIYVFRREGFGQWVLEDRIALFEGNDPNERYATVAMAMDGDTITLYEFSGGKGVCSLRFEAYERDANNDWSMTTRIQEDDQPCADFKMAVKGGIAVVGDSALQDGKGGVRVFRRGQSGAWFRAEDLIPGDAQASVFGIRGVAFDGRTLLVGTPLQFVNRFYTFELQPDDTFAELAVQFSDQFSLPSNPGYGFSIGVDGDDAFVGVPFARNAFPGEFDMGAIAFYDRGLTDTDLDGLFDDWETDGIPYTKGDGTTGRLPLPGADPLRKDIYIEVDTGISGIPLSSRTAVIDAFARAPVNNPDGSTGITLHILMDESGVVPPNPTVAFGGFPQDFETLQADRFGTEAERADPDAAALLDAKRQAVRYCFAYAGINFTGGARAYAGRGLINGPAMVINMSSGQFNDGRFDDLDIAATFMHELGHLLGLRHGGGDNKLGKPNYPSIMNYTMTHPLPWNRRFWRLDYSRETLATLDESALNESVGVNSTLYRRTFLPFGVGPDNARSFRLVKLTGRPTDFNGNGVRGGVVAADLNFVGTNAGVVGLDEPSPGEPLHGFNDWQNLIYTIGVGSERGGDASGVDGCADELTVALLETLVVPECEVDLDENGVINFFDIAAFLAAYNASDTEVDLAEPFGIFDAADIQAYLDAFLSGCP